MSTRQVGTIDKKTIELLGLSIAPDTPILLGESNINHMKESHPEDYEKYFSSLEAILAAPDYVNLNPKDGSIKYIKTVDEHVVVGVRVSTKGKAFARTIFTIEEWKFKQYADGGYLKEHTKKA
ncbi:PBECR2 nuclease fold domain-containing protein [Anaerovibrio lipolyticus]|uniref:PBECR3 domain-containing polyvalent protein n=1 Tax=Anaerovibrio lipolyticus TaxID=82374 RepID=UPI0026EBF191|nr:PBECR2 nuclease fold domain-containing protein [Anaerovibrio lipolyticus]MBE6106757.1 transposase [Anaerovibrio lipolyticus]